MVFWPNVGAWVDAQVDKELQDWPRLCNHVFGNGVRFIGSNRKQKVLERRPTSSVKYYDKLHACV